MPRPVAKAPGREQIDLIAMFATSLVEHYGAVSIPNDKGHRQYSNPWGDVSMPVSYIFILKTTMRVRYGKGSGPAQSMWMSDKMIRHIAERKLPRKGEAAKHSPIQITGG